MPANNHARHSESERVYAAILELRKRGHRVRRAGGLYHLVDGRRLRFDHVIEMAKVAEDK